MTASSMLMAASGADRVGVDWTTVPGVSNTAGSYPGTIGKQTKDACFGNGIYVFVGIDGTALTSTDTISWANNADLAKIFGQIYITGVCWSGSVFVAIGGNISAISTDGLNWAAGSNSLHLADNICWMGTKFIVFGKDAKTYTSTDGISWTQQGTSSTSFLSAMGAESSYTPFDTFHSIWTGSKIVVTGYKRSAVSTDGIVWAGYNVDVGSTPASSRGLIWNGTFFYTWNDIPLIYKSADGITWTTESDLLLNLWSALGASSTELFYLAFSGSVLFAAASAMWTASEIQTRVAVCTNGLNWVIKAIPSRIKFVELFRFINGKLIVIGSNYEAPDEHYLNISSDNAVTWADRSAYRGANFVLKNQRIVGIATNGSLYVAVTDGKMCATSSDGIAWTYRGGLLSAITAAGDTTIVPSAVCYGLGVFVALCGTAVATSTDGITWTINTLGGAFGMSYGGWYTVQNLANDIAVSNSRFVLVGDDSICLTSTDGLNWVDGGRGSASNFSTVFVVDGSGGSASATHVMWTGTMFVVTSSAAAAVYSTDGITWALFPLQTSGSIYRDSSVAFNGQKYVAVSDNGFCATSTNGTSWVNSPLLNDFVVANNITSPKCQVIWTGTKFVAIMVGHYNTEQSVYTDYSYVLNSQDGVTWTNQTRFASVKNGNSMYKLFWSGNRLFSLGNNSTLLTSQ